MGESKHESLATEIERNNYVRAAALALSRGLCDEKIRDLRLKALCQMAAVNRNALGTKILANQYGYSKKEVKHILEKYAKEMRNRGSTKPLDMCYDYSISKYIIFEEWLDLSIKKWDKL